MIGKLPPWNQAVSLVWDSKRIDPMTPKIADRASMQ